MTTWLICLIFLIGAAFGGTGYVLCIGDDGHVEFETYCPPGCSEAAEIRESDKSNDLEHEHSDCSNCSDVEIDNPSWSQRAQKTDSYRLSQSPPAHSNNTDFSQISEEIYNSPINKFYRIYGQSPPSDLIAKTVLRC